MSDSSTNFFQESNPKLDEIKKALESDSVSAKLDAMKRLIAVGFLFLSILLSAHDEAQEVSQDGF